MASNSPPPALSTLPPELLDHIVSHLPTASSLASLSRTSKALHAYVSQNAWATFTRTRFPSLIPLTPHTLDGATARSLTTLSRAWDRRAFVGRYAEPQFAEPRNSVLTAWPGRRRVEHWKRPKGQTIGYSPRLDVYEGDERDETFAFSAGAEICIRETRRYLPGQGEAAEEDSRWVSYRPEGAREGVDDVTALHLLRPGLSPVAEDSSIALVAGRANGDLHRLTIPSDFSQQPDPSVGTSSFATHGLPVRSSALLQTAGQPTLLAASLGDSHIALYDADSEQAEIQPSSEMTIRPALGADGHPTSAYRAWSTTFLSPSILAVGGGLSAEPIHIYPITATGISRDSLRKFTVDSSRKQSSVHTIVPLPPSTAGSVSGQVFLSGAHDGILRLHDLRSACDCEQSYVDAADDSPIYSILPRGQEKVVAGASRNNLLKVFDLRLGAKRYDHLDALSAAQPRRRDRQAEDGAGIDFNIFLRPYEPRGGRRWALNRPMGNRSSSIYTLASPTAHSPFIYAGIENAVIALAFTEVLDPRPDPAYFARWAAFQDGAARDVVRLTMYEGDMQLKAQRSLWDTWQVGRNEEYSGGLDERWSAVAD